MTSTHLGGHVASDRANQLFQAERLRVHCATDRLFIWIMMIQWIAGIAVALWVSPRTWIGLEYETHVHVYYAIFLGAGIASLPAYLVFRHPGSISTRHVIAISQMLWSALLIHLSGGRIETHFHVFGSMALLALYRDWKVICTATVVVALDHALRGYLWPESVFGVSSAASWRWMEHAGWVLFLDLFLVIACIRSTRELRALTERHSLLEGTNAAIEKEVERRTYELREANEVAQHASRAKSEFLANMSHEIRTPMTAILGFSDLLADPTTTAESRSDYIETIQSNGKHLLAIINDILDLSKIEVGKMTVERVQCEPCSVVAEVVSLMRVRAIGKGIELDVNYHAPFPASIHSDPIRLRQILVNLVGNAIKFTETGGVTVDVGFVQGFDDAPSRVEFTVKDTGIGMSAAQMKNLFQPFMQGDTSTMRKFGGSGLGLAISTRLAKLMGGHIRAQSKLGDGSEFTLAVDPGDLEGVELLSDPLNESVQAKTSRPAPKAEDKVGARILLAEDGRDNQLLISCLLRKHGMTVEVAANGKIALDMVQAAANSGSNYDVILMDMQMPELDGYAATRTLRDQGYGAPIIALTAHAMSGDRERCLDAGCDDYDTKPIDASRLIGKIRDYAEQNA